jgi:hypothetical protein
MLNTSTFLEALKVEGRRTQASEGGRFRHVQAPSGPGESRCFPHAAPPEIVSGRV